MKFKIGKVSTRFEYSPSEPPIPGAVHGGKKQNGTDYKTTPPSPVYKDLWEIEINTLDELIALIKEHGTIIMNEDDIEIYDDYSD